MSKSGPVNSLAPGTLVFKLPDGIRFKAGPNLWTIEPISLGINDWYAFVPDETEPVVDPSVALAWIFATMQEPLRGAVELNGFDVYRLDPGQRQRLRARVGFVHGYGGLLSNRTVRENVGLPASVHSKQSEAELASLVDETLVRLALDRVAELRPHEMDGATRWRACLGRALLLSPKWLVLEGIGNWEMDRGRGKGWQYLVEYQRRGVAASAICMARHHPEFESWFREQGGVVVGYQRYRPPGEEQGQR